jgi:hypothetical protein
MAKYRVNPMKKTKSKHPRKRGMPMKSLFAKKEELVQVAVPENPPAGDSPKGSRLPYRREGERYIFGSKVVSPYKDMGPEPKPPQVEDLVRFDDLKLDKISHETRRSIPQVRRNAEGVLFVFMKISIEMKDGKKVSGLMPLNDWQKFKAARESFGWPLWLDSPKQVGKGNEGSSQPKG